MSNREALLSPTLQAAGWSRAATSGNPRGTQRHPLDPTLRRTLAGYVILEGDVILGGASLQTGESAETEARMAVQKNTQGYLVQ